MPWVRIDENAMEHRKILVLSAEAFRLWVRGLAHCQKHLTDGLITVNDLKAIRGVTKARVEELTTPVSPGESPLWEKHELGFLVHDYLEWNESKEHVLHARAAAKERIKRLRDKGKCNGVTNGERFEDVTGSSLSGVLCSSGSFSERKKESAAERDSLGARAGDFIERYKALHVRLRKGAHYIGKPTFDFQEAMQLAAVYDDARLDKLAFVWLNTDHQFAESGTRSLAKFRSMASWCEEQLIAWEQKNGPLEVAS